MTQNSDQATQVKAPVQATDALTALQKDIALASAEITRREFSETGAGSPGIAFRAIKRVSDENMEDIWSQIFSICQSLWEANEIVAAIVLIETASRQFFIPDSMMERVNKSIEDAKSFKVMKLAEEAFESGEDDKALRLTSELPTSFRATYSDDLHARIKRRQKTRKTALWVAGVSISSLAVVAVIGVFSFVELLKDPPRPQLPDFSASNRMLDDIFSKQEGVLNSPSVSNTKSIEPSTNSPKKSPGLVFQSETPPVVGDPSVSGPEIPKTVPEAPAAPEPVEEISIPIPPLEPIAEPNPQVQQPATQNRATRENCVLGFAVLQRATTMLQDRPDEAAARRKVAGFMSTLQDACRDLKLDPVALSLEAGMVPRDEVEDIALSIIE